jgi:carbon monoxide dehydrogenase subunit G
MELTNDFRVALPIERAWAVLTDVELIAPCLPGAQLTEIEGDDYRGVVKVKVGPITAQYKGQAKFLSLDAEKHVAVLRAEGRETRGQGNANATITATLTPDGEGTAVAILTELTITGRVAQFGRGVLADVSAKLLDQFVADLEKTVLADDSGAPVEAVEVALEDPIEATQPDAEAPELPLTADPAPEADAAPAVAAAPTIRKIDSPEPEPVDLIGTAGSPIVRRVTPVLVAIAALWILKKLLTRNKD